MSKELKAFEDIKNYVINGHSLALETEEKGFPLIENALNELEEYKSILKDFGLENPQNLIDNLNIIKDSKFHEKLKALEIIKEKKWLVEDILNAFIEDKEEYELLKEVLE